MRINPAASVGAAALPCLAASLAVSLAVSLTASLAAFFAVSLTACDTRGGAAPTIKALTLGDTTVMVDGEDVINGAFEFSDADGDADLIVFEVVLPDDTTRVIGPDKVPGLYNRSRGTVTFSLRFPRDPAGRYEITVWLVDAEGLESNRLSGTTVSRF